jgi:hypothetical protein
MKRTTIFIDEAVEADMRAVARQEGRPLAAVVREAFGDYLRNRKQRKGKRLAFIAVGRSGYRDTAERNEELLWQNPHSPKRASSKRAKRPTRQKA